MRLDQDKLAATAQRRVLLVASPGCDAFDIVGPYEVFARATELLTARSFRRWRGYEVVIVASQEGLVRTSRGLSVHAQRSLPDAEELAIDTVIVAGPPEGGSNPDVLDILDWLRRVRPNVRRFCSVSAGVFLLGQAGLLEGKRATSHWRDSERLGRAHPRVRVEAGATFVRSENVYTSSGQTAAIDLALSLVEEDFGSHIPFQIARELLLYLRRQGSDPQLSAALSLQSSQKERLDSLVPWILANLKNDLSVTALGRQVAMSPRSLARALAKHMNTTPARFVEALRVKMAQRKLAQRDLRFGEIALECGFHSSGHMRRAFQRVATNLPAGHGRNPQEFLVAERTG